LCFGKQEWERGLPPLSRGDAEPLKSAALRDLAASTPETQMEAADAWLALSEKQPSARGRIADHALALYKRAWPAAQGGVKDALRAKLRSIAIHPSRATAPLPASWNPGTDSAKDAFTIEDGCPHSGRLAVRIAASAKPGVIGSTLKKIPQGRVCTLSGWILVDSQEAIGDILFINLSDGKNPDSVKNFIVTTPGDQPWWTFLQTTFTVPVGTASLGMQLKYGFKTGSVWVDDLSCKMDDGTELFENGGFEK
ncbi:MAG: hypothetical protein HY293_16945, partial [Planctomycetes bacterium]|nr:hypothetical protein [Planctomycetota bacterium]